MSTKEIQERKYYEEWYGDLQKNVYEKEATLWISKIDNLFEKTNNLKEIKKLDSEELEIVRHAFIIPISDDRWEILTLRGKNSMKFMQENESRLLFGHLSNELVRSVINDRLIISNVKTHLRNGQEAFQMNKVEDILRMKKYVLTDEPDFLKISKNNYRARQGAGIDDDNIIVDVFIRKETSMVFLELKSASDTANTSKRWKEETARYEKLKKIMNSEKNKEKIEWKLIIIFAGYVTENAMIKFERGKHASCIWFHDINKLKDFL